MEEIVTQWDAVVEMITEDGRGGRDDNRWGGGAQTIFALWYRALPVLE